MIYAFNLFPLISVLDRDLAAPSEATNVLDIAPCKTRLQFLRMSLRTVRTISVASIAVTLPEADNVSILEVKERIGSTRTLKVVINQS